MSEVIKVEQLSEKEIWVGQNQIIIGDHNIIYFNARGIHDASIATKINEAIFKLGDTLAGKVNVLTDLNYAQKSSHEARKIWQESSRHKKSGKTALIGLHPVARVLASFVIGGKPNGKTRFFPNKEQAIIWLME